MFGWNSVSQEEKAALEALRSGDLKKAYAALRPVIDYPGKLSSEKSWSSVWRTFADVADRITGPELAGRCAISKGHTTCAACDDYSGCSELSGFFGQVPQAKANLEKLRT